MVAVTHAVPATGAPDALTAWLAGLAGTYPEDELAGARRRGALRVRALRRREGS